jgi:hypothetical protein
MPKIRIPVGNIRYPPNKKGVSPNIRKITIGQLAVMLGHYYKVASDPDIGHLDADVTLEKFLGQKLNRSVPIYREDLEKLLWATNIANTAGYYWSPDGKNYKKFIEDILIKEEEYFDYENNLITSKKEKEE